jgi:DNA-binding winged helix-turn-helix (wHTH) protein/predicted ATPase
MKEGQEEAEITFGPFRLLPGARQLWRDGARVKLRPRSLAVLIYLVQSSGQVVSSDELRQGVWAGTYVSRTVIRVCVREIRQALEDDVTHPRYLDTIGQQGYQFIAPLTTFLPVLSPQCSAPSSNSQGQGQPLTSGNWRLVTPFVGREKELVQLHEWAAQARQGQRRLILVNGEAGIGKSTLVNQFISQVRRRANVWVGLGQCVETYGRGEAYLPLLDALGRVGRETGASRLAAVLRQHAPTWLMQLPALSTVMERETLHQHVAGATPERMLRELSEALEVLTADHLGILILEDLQWSDAATAAWLAAWMRRPESARMLLIGSYRPNDVIVHGHLLRGLVQELRAHRLCRELPLELLTEAEVTRYVQQRFADNLTTTALAAHIYQRTDGNPLFMVTSLDALIQQHLVVEEAGQWRLRGDLASVASHVPDDLHQLITRQIEDLPPEEQQALEVASVVGMTFSAVTVAAGCKQEEDVIEDLCERLTQRGQFIEAQEIVEWPDGTISAGYRFRHVLYQHVLYDRLGRSRQVRLHQLIGEQLASAYHGQEAAMASWLATHFARGRQYEKAVRYHQLAAGEALRRSGYQEVQQHCSQGLALLTHLPATIDRARQELGLRTTFSTALAATEGFAAETLSEHLERAHALCKEVGDTVTLVPVLIGLGRLFHTRGDRVLTEEVMERERRLLEDCQDATLAIQLATQLCALETFAGCHDRAQAHYAEVLKLFTVAAHSTRPLAFGPDPLVMAALTSSTGLWLTGQPEQAIRRLEQGLARAEELGHPMSLVNGMFFGTFVRLCRGEFDKAQLLVQRLVTLSQEQGFTLYKVGGAILQGCLAVQQGKGREGAGAIADGLVRYREMNAQIYAPFFLSLLATGYWQQGWIEDGLQVITEALHLTEATLESFWRAELYRIKGHLILQSGVRSPESQKESQKSKIKGQKSKATNLQPLMSDAQGEAEACFRQAIEVARRQGARSLELRATMSLARLWRQQGKPGEARHILSTLYDRFTEGWDTKDLQDAKALLAELL